MEYVIGLDLGTSSIKGILVDREGTIAAEESESYPIYHEQDGHSEQDPEDWVRQTKSVLKKLIQNNSLAGSDIKGISFSGQMHGLVLLDGDNHPLRRAILWNDTRTSREVKEIEEAAGQETLWNITKNSPLEGFTLPKILWVKKHEPDLFSRAELFLLPKDYVRYRLTGKLGMDLSDAAGTLLMDLNTNEWSTSLLDTFELPSYMCPPLFPATENCGGMLEDVAAETGCSSSVMIFAGGADNACGAVGAGILEKGKTMCSIGTSGVLLSYAGEEKTHFNGKLHFFNHAPADTYYAMGVTLAAGYSLQWFKESFLKEDNFSEMVQATEEVPAGARGLLFTPYIAGERTPHNDALARGSFVGMDSSHKKSEFVKAIIEGITFSLKESLNIIEQNGMKVDTIVSIGGGAKSRAWLQMQADIFGKEVVSLRNEQGPAMGAAIIAAAGCGWYASLQEAAAVFVQNDVSVTPDPEKMKRYEQIFPLYQKVYTQTKEITKELAAFR